jgi:TonB family protein
MLNTKLGAALVASVLLHAGLLGSTAYLIGGARDAAAPRPAALHARIIQQAELAPPQQIAAPQRKASELAAPDALPVLPGPRYLAAGELDQRPLPLTNITLEYPEGVPPRDARVVARILINEDGRVDEVQILSAGPESAFDRLVISAFGGASYRPGQRDRRPVKSQMTVEVKFVPEDPETGPREP